jgi:hypothetical protein
MNSLSQKKKIKNILSQVDLNIVELQYVITVNEKKIILPKTIKNKELIIGIKKNLEFLNDLENIFIIAKKYV